MYLFHTTVGLKVVITQLNKQGSVFCFVNFCSHLMCLIVLHFFLAVSLELLEKVGWFSFKLLSSVSTRNILGFNPCLQIMWEKVLNIPIPLILNLFSVYLKHYWLFSYLWNFGIQLYVLKHYVALIFLKKKLAFCQSYFECQEIKAFSFQGKICRWKLNCTLTTLIK